MRISNIQKEFHKTANLTVKNGNFNITYVSVPNFMLMTDMMFVLLYKCVIVIVEDDTINNNKEQQDGGQIKNENELTD